jgi:hypothetical protein
MKLIPILNQGAEGIERLKAAAPIFTQEDIDKMEALHKATVNLDAAELSLSKSITGALAPAMAAYLNDASEGMDVLLDKAKKLSDWWNHVTPPASGTTHWTSLDWGDGHNGPPKPQPAPPSLATVTSGGAGGAPAAPDSGLPWNEVAGGGGQYQLRADLHGGALADEAAKAAQAAKDAADAWAKLQGAEADQLASAAALFGDHAAPAVALAAQTKATDLTGIDNEAEKFAHGVFDPLFDIGEKWSKQMKQIRANMLKDVGQGAESQLFGALFGDSSGRGGKGWDGSGGDGKGGHNGLIDEGIGAVGGLLGNLFKPKGGSTSNGGLGSGAGTIPSAAASLLQMGKGAAAGAGVQVVINNSGTPQQVDQTQTSGGGIEQMVVQIFMKDLSTNGPMSQGIAGVGGGG